MEISKNYSVSCDIEYNYELLAFLCLVVYATKGCTQSQRELFSLREVLQNESWGYLILSIHAPVRGSIFGRGFESPWDHQIIKATQRGCLFHYHFERGWPENRPTPSIFLSIKCSRLQEHLSKCIDMR